MEIKGKITAVPPLVTGTSARGEWKKAAIVVTYEDGQYPKSLLLTNMQKAEEFSKLKVGQQGIFKFDGNVRQSASNGNYYMDLTCWEWKIAIPAPSPTSGAVAVSGPAPTAGSDDLPF